MAKKLDVTKKDVESDSTPPKAEKSGVDEPVAVVVKKELTPEERIEEEKTNTLSWALGGRITNTKQRVAFILNNYSEARNSDKKLTWLYWRLFESERWDGKVVSYENYMSLTKSSSLVRIRARIQNTLKLFLADATVREFRGTLEADEREIAIESTPQFPHHTVYIDETGKTQEFTSVGSLWISDTRSFVFGTMKLNEWKKARVGTKEFHFVGVNNRKLDDYKAFVLKFIELFPTAAFKVIVVKRDGLKDKNALITDLTFHLLWKGIIHENDTGRARLPRRLELILDREEKGTDSMKIENLTERFTALNIKGLELGTFEAVDSKNNAFVQIVDLFTSSINRKLHHPESHSKAKDILAEFVLNLVGFDLNLLDKANQNPDAATVFNLDFPASSEEETVDESAKEKEKEEELDSKKKKDEDDEPKQSILF